MTYNSNLQAVEQEALVELYTFTLGGDSERYTSYTKQIIFQGFTYNPVPIKRTGFNYDVQFGKVSVRITAIISDMLRKYISNQPLEPVTVSIHRALSSDLTEYAVLMIGQIKAVTMKNNQATATVEANSDHLSARVPVVVYQSGCNHIVFDNGCGLSKMLWKTTAPVDVSGSKLTSTVFGAQADGYFTGGKVSFGEDARLITDHTGSALTLHIAFDSRLFSGSSVDVWPGCDGVASTCKTKFSNFTHFLGFPYIPTTNPVMYGVK